jgi:hypothetical protein
MSSVRITLSPLPFPPSLNLHLRPRLSTVAAELRSLRELVSVVNLVAGTDERIMIWGEQSDSFFGAAYRALTSTGFLDANGARIWATKVPTKLKFFAWLLCNDRLPTRANLLHKNILCEEEAVCPRGCAVIETATHIFFECPATALVWASLQIGHEDARVTDPWGCTYPPHLLAPVSDDFLLIVVWRVWHSRNDMVFRSQGASAVATLRLIVSDLDLWSHRLRDCIRKFQLSSGVPT